MGNALRFLYGQCCAPSTQESEFLGPHGVTAETVGVSALARDIFHFEITSQVIFFILTLFTLHLVMLFTYKSNSRAVWGSGYLIILLVAFFGSNYLVPDGLSQHVVSSKKAQANWYRKLLDAWKEAKPPPKTPEEAARLIIQTLKRHQKADVQGLLGFYGLSLPHTLVETSGVPSSWPQGVKFELETLPVDVKSVADGDTITVYVDTKESSSVPKEVLEATIRRSKARAVRNYPEADALQQKIVDAGYRVLNDLHNENILARKYRIRLRGIDAPESKMPFGKEAKQELVKLVQGKCLKVHVYEEDRYGRHVGDVYCNGIFVQAIRVRVMGLHPQGYVLNTQTTEMMLKKGLAWHYIAYDQRPEFALWEREARASRIGLWASSNPEKPWEWRKDRRGGT